MTARLQSRKVLDEILTAPRRPFLKWPGGKQWLAPAAPLLIPTDWSGDYYEPFLGGGSFFFALSPERATLSDVNAELVETYAAVRDDVNGVIGILRRFRNDAATYERVKRSRPRTPHGVAARLIYLNKTAFNGMYRVNRAGAFNVPFGNYEAVTVCQTGRLTRAAESLAHATFRSGDFEQLADGATAKSVVYFDPPYITGHTNNGFVKYNARLFAWADQRRLAAFAQRLSERGAYVIVSTADASAVTDLYPGFYYYRLSRRTPIAANIDARTKVKEALLTNYPIPRIVTERIGGAVPKRGVRASPRSRR